MIVPLGLLEDTRTLVDRHLSKTGHRTAGNLNCAGFVVRVWTEAFTAQQQEKMRTWSATQLGCDAAALAACPAFCILTVPQAWIRWNANSLLHRSRRTALANRCYTKYVAFSSASGHFCFFRTSCCPIGHAKKICLMTSWIRSSYT